VASVNFICSPEEARRRIKRVEQLGFEEILIGSQIRRDRGMFRNAGEFVTLYPGDRRPARDFCAPRLERGSLS
jgi:hypothetical protein